jgi:hypothetical protein
MNKEYDRDLEEIIMENHWSIVEDKSYPKFKGVWEKRSILPVTHTSGFEKETDIPHLEIPFVGEGYIRLGRTKDKNALISAKIKYSTARGDVDMREDEFIVTDGLDHKPYDFWIFFDSEYEEERMKYLARMNPERDIDWEKIKPGTKEYEIAKAFCKYKEVESKPKRYYYFI